MSCERSVLDIDRDPVNSGSVLHRGQLVARITKNLQIEGEYSARIKCDDVVLDTENQYDERTGIFDIDKKGLRQKTRLLISFDCQSYVYPNKSWDPGGPGTVLVACVNCTDEKKPFIIYDARSHIRQFRYIDSEHSIDTPYVSTFNILSSTRLIELDGNSRIWFQARTNRWESSVKKITTFNLYILDVSYDEVY